MRLPLPCFLVSSASIPQTEISHSTGVKIRAALLLVGWLPVNLLCTGVQDSHTKHTPTYALSLTVHETCSFNWLHEWLSAQIMLSGKQENVEFPKKKTLHKLKSSSLLRQSSVYKSSSPESVSLRQNVPYQAKNINTMMGCILHFQTQRHRSKSYWEVNRNKHHCIPKPFSRKACTPSTEHCLHQVNNHFSRLCLFWR